MRKKKFFTIVYLLLILFIPLGGEAWAQTTGTGAPGLRIDISGSNDEGDFGVAIQLVVAMSILTMGPSVLMMMTCFHLLKNVMIKNPSKIQIKKNKKDMILA